MLKFSKKTDYAIILLAHLGAVDLPVSAQEIADVYELPQPMMANILKQLCVAGLVQSMRGQSGGYVLAKTPEEITLTDIIFVTDNLFTLVECAHDEEVCKVHRYCPTREPLVTLHKKIQRFMEETTLASIMTEALIKHPLTQETLDENPHLS